MTDLAQPLNFEQAFQVARELFDSWTTDGYRFVVRDGYFYDNKYGWIFTPITFPFHDLGEEVYQAQAQLVIKYTGEIINLPYFTAEASLNSIIGQFEDENPDKARP